LTIKKRDDSKAAKARRLSRKKTVRGEYTYVLGILSFDYRN
jgi:hypothetical protein